MSRFELHTTDIQQFVQCRLRWLWQSPLKYNLQPAGQPPALFLGQGVHYALDTYYTSGRDVDAALDVFRGWCTKRADGIRELTGTLWDTERDMINNMYRLGHDMIRHYDLWSGTMDQDMELVGNEIMFDLPVPTLDSSPPPVDLRIAGRIDGAFRRDGKVYLLEFKTASQLRYAPATMRSLQTGVYLWAARQLYENVEGMVYRFLLKKVPQPLKWLDSSQRFSKAVSQKTTFEWALMQLREWARANEVSSSEMNAEYRPFLLQLQENGNDFFMERVIHRTPVQLQDIGKALYSYGKMMSDPDVAIFESGGFHCSYCPFADPCTLREKGMDHQALLDAEYETRDYWEEDE